MAMELSSAEKDGKYTIAVKGEIDLYSSPDLRSAITKAIPSANAALHIDLREVEYMDSSGVATLVEGLRSSMEKSVAFVLVAPAPPVLKVLQLSRLDTVFTIKDRA